MASSQVEIASSSPFGCVLKDHNRRDRCSKESNAKAQAVFQKNLKELVRDHLHSCISVSSDSSANENSENRMNNNSSNNNINNHNRPYLRCLTNHQSNNIDDSSTMSCKQGKILDRWAAKQAQEMVSTIERQNEEAEILISAKENSNSTQNSAAQSQRISVKESSNSTQNSAAQSDRISAKENPNSTQISAAQSEIISLKENANATQHSAAQSARISAKENPNSTQHSAAQSEGNSAKENSNSTQNSAAQSGRISAKENPNSTQNFAKENSNSTQNSAAQSERIPAKEIPHSTHNSAAQSERISAKENPNFAAQSENLCGSSNLGASSLVQIWEARLHRPEPKVDQSSTTKNSQNSTTSTSRTSSTSSYNEIVSSPVEEPPRKSDVVDSAANELPRQTEVIDSNANEETVDWDSAAQSSTSSVPVKSSDVGDKERVRIADIIKRLTSDNNEHEQGNTSAGDASSLRRLSYGSDHAELKALPHVINSPKIRGRQAFNDLLLQIEQERQRELYSLAERQSVSRFPQRGRIQSMLRLRCLQRCLAIQNQHRSQPIRTIICGDPNRSQQGSTKMHLRERFRPAVDQTTSSLTAPIVNPRSSKENANSIVNNENHPSSSSTSLNLVISDGNKNEPCTEKQTVINTPAVDKSLSQTSEVYEEDAHEEASASSDVTWQGTNSESDHFDAGEVLESDNWNENVMEDEEEETDQINYDWFTNIARPRSYWEDKRQAWYQEMLTTSSDNNEIKKLLERKAVSNCLSSEFRERMDQLMTSHVQRQVNREEEELDAEGQERMGQLILSYYQRHSHSTEEQEDQNANEVQRGGEVVEEEEEEEEEVEEEEEAEEESLPSMHSPSPYTSWDYSHHHEVADTSELASITPPEQGLPFQGSNQETQHFSSATHPSIEVDLIFNLRGHMEQLHREMSELKKTMQTCMEMQVTLMNSLKQEVHPVPEATMNSIDITRKRRNCCICYERQVDSFLYRCGHMCTCLRCAHELQWSSGKCPICRAPILDVVKAYMDS